MKSKAKGVFDNTGYYFISHRTFTPQGLKKYTHQLRWVPFSEKSNKISYKYVPKMYLNTHKNIKSPIK